MGPAASQARHVEAPEAGSTVFPARAVQLSGLVQRRRGEDNLVEEAICAPEGRDTWAIVSGKCKMRPGRGFVFRGRCREGM